MLDTKNSYFEPLRYPDHRFEALRTYKRRSFTPEDKARIVAESYTSGDSVCAVARRHSLSTSQLFAWRKIARRCRDASPEDPPPVPERSEGESHPKGSGRRTAQIEIAIGSAVVRVPHGIDPVTLRLVLDTLRDV